MKKFYLFSEKGKTESFYCGNIYEAFSCDEIKVDDELMTFEFAEEIERCKSFSTKKEAEDYRWGEEGCMEDSNNYANRAMECAGYYGCEGVDDMRYEN